MPKKTTWRAIDKKTGKIVVEGSREEVAAYFGKKPDMLRVYKHNLGGICGCTLENDFKIPKPPNPGERTPQQEHYYRNREKILQAMHDNREYKKRVKERNERLLGGA